MALGHLNPLRGHIRARTQPGTDHRLLTDIHDQTRRRVGPQLLGHPETDTLSEERRTLQSELIDQLLHRLTDKQLHRSRSRSINGLPHDRDERHRQHRRHRNVDR
ncbi:hypothetical protein AWN90_07515 [Nocardia terpenica]|uniref:Uncharacterized protein n=1 Tax=Nocardia terpenica TaxID=455432 RepID=A0A164IP56_9NOCA|nr:hypothetical protein AWN90_07515 [Nocardia terpenica]